VPTSPDKYGGSAWRATLADAALFLVLGVFLLAKILHHLYWFTVWGNTCDLLGYLLLLVPVLAVLFSGVTLAITLRGRMKWTGPATRIFWR
ncbi:MAG: hypothetical protein U9R15_14020, partial [Chloroflexota bacterium]|nr:hypothetical protein [Chloroflexota bacterium]